ncbi:YcxB family protein [Planococcus sp. N028]|uniref:YcxB family protein n=1 Tax=Planococcus shixiaomingii TaxID=3058393 RepID=A0ABT8N5E5_9BACL|nr:YcxB family protein [Planococcus sp. N028]MDN7242765.1 YcxB family protein [Planococcus sp. N028]
MEINYSITEEDYVDFNLFHARNSKSLKKAITIQRVLIPLIYLLIPVLLSYILDMPFLFLFVPFLVFSILWAVYYPAFVYRNVKRTATKMIKEGKNEDMLGQHTMIFSDEGLREISSKGEKTVNWSGIEQLAEDTANFYIYNSAVSAFIIPKKDVKNRKELKSYLLGKIELTNFNGGN